MTKKKKAKSKPILLRLGKNPEAEKFINEKAEEMGLGRASVVRIYLLKGIESERVFIRTV